MLVADRKDFVAPGTYCARPDSNGHRHGFPTEKAYILVDEAGREYPYGPSCVKQLGYLLDLHGIPDFTARDGEASPGAGHTGTGASSLGSDRDVDTTVRELAIAKRYLLLRMEKVANIPGINGDVRYHPLNEIYQDYRRTRLLDANCVARIIAIDRGERTPDRFRTNNLLDVYTAEVQLSRQLERELPEHRRKFLLSIRDWLRSHLKLSRAQIEKAGLNLHRQAFGG